MTEPFGQRHAGKAGANGQAESRPQPRDSFGGAGYGASNARVQSGRGWYAPAYVEHAPTQAVATLFRVLGDCAQDAGPTCARVSVLRPHDAARSKQRIGGPHRCAHAWNGRGGETETAGAATRQVKVCDPRNPRYNDARSLAVGEFIDWLGVAYEDKGNTDDDDTEICRDAAAPRGRFGKAGNASAG